MGLLSATLRKRSSNESNKDNQTNEDSDCTLLLQPEDKRKREKFDSESDKTLEDLPIELLECILLKVVAMEVKALKLAKSVWEEKADLAINQLRTVCPLWNSILTTKSFQKKLHRTLDAAQETKIRLEILLETPICAKVTMLTTLKDDIFMLSSVDTPNKHCIVNVYDRNNMAEVKDVITLPGSNTFTYYLRGCHVSTAHWLRGCSVSNCVYVLMESNNCRSVLRIERDAKDKLIVAPWKYDQKLPLSTLSVCANGNLVILSLQGQQGPHFAGIYKADGSLENRIELPRDDDTIAYHSEVTQKSNGNLIVGITSNPGYKKKLLEMDMKGSVVRQYAASLDDLSFIHFADSYDRILITEWFKMHLIDSEFNALGDYSLQQDKGKTLWPHDLHYENERDEILRVHFDMNAEILVLTIFRFKEE